MKYLFVCSGNTCRSPMAEAIMRSLAPETDLVSSAGLMGHDSMTRSAHAIDALREIGLSLVGPSRSLTDGSIAWADVVLCMEERHKRAILFEHPEAAEKVMTLGEWSGSPDAEIDDPFGREIESYREIRDEIEKLIKKGLARETR